MPTHCCVPGCTKKGYREEHGSKVSYFQFPREKIVKKKWIQAIRRDEGKDFKISDSTKVCSRHFRNEDLKKTLAGKICLKPGAIPSIFSWIRTSPRKRKPPTERNVCEPVASIAAVSRSNASAESVVEFDLEEKVEVSIGLTTSVVENQNIILPEKECYDLTETITNKNKRIEELEQEINDIKLRLENAQRQITNLTKKQFVLENLKAKKNTAAFYTGFNNWDAFEAVYNYRDPGERGGNIISKNRLAFNKLVGTMWWSLSAMDFPEFKIWRFISTLVNIDIFSSEVPQPSSGNCTKIPSSPLTSVKVLNRSFLRL